MAVNYVERRLHPRIAIEGDMRYQFSHSNEIRTGLLENLSERGARIWINEELDVASQLLILVESDSGEHADMTFKATLLYRLPQRNASKFGYGCSIELSNEWQPRLD